jgi:hypothetical protein
MAKSVLLQPMIGAPLALLHQHGSATTGLFPDQQDVDA